MKIIFLILLTLGAFQFSNAQNKSEDINDGYRLFHSAGIFAGVDLTGFSGDAPVDASYAGSPGFLAGISIELNITKDIKLLVQPMYNIRNTKLKYDIGEKELKDSLRLGFDYIRVPLVVKLNALNGVTYFVSGIDFGFLLSSRANDIEKKNPERDISSYLNEFDFAALFGIGVNIKISSNNLFAELRYTQSLTNMSNNDVNKFGSYLPTRFRFTGFQLQTGFNFSL